MDDTLIKTRVVVFAVDLNKTSLSR